MQALNKPTFVARTTVAKVATLIKATQGSKQAVKAMVKPFITGGSQAIRLPKAFRFATEHVQIERNALGQVVLTEIGDHAYDKRLHALTDLFQSFADKPLGPDESFDPFARELTDFRTPDEKAAGEPAITFETPSVRSGNAHVSAIAP